MLTAAIALAVASIAWGILRGRARRAGDPSRARRMREALHELAVENQLAFEPASDARVDAVSGEKDGVRFCIEAGTRGMLFDGDIVVISPCASDDRVVVWPRDPPNAVIEGLGEERTTGDRVFDARFASFWSSGAMAHLAVDEETRRSFYQLGIVAPVVREREALLLLPGGAGGDDASSRMSRSVSPPESPDLTGPRWERQSLR